ncbi:hypothetical protein ACJMK2_033944 [Sinanodonta woodiana]|uniref:Uncharacterized protein n=1 Tax=Sinanodonta woodiana TaxID=1069815 RepID=A0ABD3WQ26_SINWO
MSERINLKQTLAMRRNYVGKSCRLHFDASPLKIVQALKQYLYDDFGNEYLDCINSVAHVGHCHPHVVSVGQEQMSQLATCYGFLNDSMVDYAKQLVETLPENLCVCYFVNSGSEANDLALRLARAYTQQSDIIVVDNAYHGNISSLIEISPSRLKTLGMEKKDWVHVVAVPDTYRGIFRESVANPGILYAQEVKKVIQKVQEKRRTIAAFMCEPIMSQAGVIIPPKPYLTEVFSYVREAGGLCIADEIQTGLGRTGEKFWGFQTHDVVPDIVTMGKPLGNGHPMAVVVTTKEVSDSLKEFSSTFGGNPVACAMGKAVLDVIHNEQMMSGAKSVGKCLLDGFRAIMPTHPMMGDVRGIGLLVGVEIVMDKQSRKPAKEAAEILAYKLKEQKIIIANEGPDKNVMTLSPPMCFTCDNARRVVQALDKALRQIENDASQAGLTSSGGYPMIENPDSAQVPFIILGDLSLNNNKGTKRVQEKDDDDDAPGGKKTCIGYDEMD